MVPGGRIESDMYWSVFHYMVGDYGGWSKSRVERMLHMTTVFWEDVMVGQRIGHATSDRIDCIKTFRETAICEFMNAAHILSL
mgnify:CR=1 FL=1